MKYAVIQLQGKQFRVEEGQDLTVDRMPQEESAKVVVSDVLMYVNDGKIEIGTPVLANISVKMTVTKHEKADKNSRCDVQLSRANAKSTIQTAETVLHIDTPQSKGRHDASRFLGETS